MKIVDIRVEVIFLVFALFFGSVFAVINPPFMAADESRHFYKAYDISQGHIIPKSSNVSIPKSFGRLMQFDPHNTSTWKPPILKDFNNEYYNSAFNDSLNINDTIEAIAVPVSYTPLPYFSTALVIKVGEVFNAAPLILMYLSRLLNLLIYCIIVYYGLKIVPIQKNMFLLIALMPMSLYQAVSISQDSLNLALAIFTICYLLNLVFKKSVVSNKDILIVSLCLLGLTLSKQVYALLGLLFFIIPKEKFINIKRRIKSFIYILLPSGVTLFAYKTFVSLVSSSNVIPALQSRGTTIPFLFRLVNSLIYYYNLYISTFVGCFGWVTNPLPLYLVYIYLVVLIVVSVFDINIFKLEIKQKLVSIFIFVTGSITIFYYAATSFSDSVVYTIFGVQGKYFIPFAPLFFQTLGSEKIAKYFDNYRLKNYLNVFVIIFIRIMLIISTYYLWNISASTWWNFYIPDFI
ncbi:MAG: DUF2142 domain-containing protein [Methanobrevibacter sp.]|jgi:uncharacterized membrane protein|nr:DUF2142 domain-containing protein [Candidatus Methanovirga procula]